jgi:hypothetical protein
MASTAWAQRVELTPLAGYTTDGRIEQTAATVSDLTIDSGITWGGQGSFFLSRHVGVEALWTYQSTDLRLHAPSGDSRLFTMTANQLVGNVVYQFVPDARLVPYVFGGLGATTFFDGSASRTETKLGWTTGVGMKGWIARHVGLKAHWRFTPTVLNDESAQTCDPFGFCQQTLSRFEVAAGPIFRF